MTQAATDPIVSSAARGGFTVRAGDRSLDELLTIAAAAARSKARVELTGVRAKPLEELVRIAVAGGDSVVFVADPAEAPPSPDPRRRRHWWFSRPTA
jgi:hypothetical protein